MTKKMKFMFEVQVPNRLNVDQIDEIGERMKVAALKGLVGASCSHGSVLFETEDFVVEEES